MLRSEKNETQAMIMSRTSIHGRKLSGVALVIAVGPPASPPRPRSSGGCIEHH